MNRLICAFAGAVAALVPLVALASPSPSPALDKVLAPAPASGYVESTSTGAGAVEGPFDAAQYAKNSSNVAGVRATLLSDGFVAGYGRTFVQQATRHALVEAVIAFSGNDGAKKWLAASELADKKDPNYQHSASTTGLGTYYGAHFYYTSSKAYGDGFAFVKGNDYFFVIAVAATNDTGPLAASQAKAQYDFAPAYTIPPSDWPQTASASVAFNIGRVIGGVFILALIAGVVILAVALVMRSRRRTPAAVAIPATNALPAQSVQMSPDGRFWWDGQGWKDTAQQIPPNVQMSPDNQSWWDGRGWRPVPRPT